MTHVSDCNKSQKAGMTWFVFGLLISITLTVTLMNIDHLLTFSSREKDLSATLYELRSAQTSLNARVTDNRLFVTQGLAESK